MKETRDNKIIYGISYSRKKRNGTLIRKLFRKRNKVTVNNSGFINKNFN